MVASRERVRAHRAGLEPRGFAVIGARSAAAAVDRLREGGIDAVLVEPPVVGRLEPLVRALQALPDPPPFLLVSNAPDAPALSARLGAAAFLPMPCGPNEVADALVRVVAPRPVPTRIDDQPTTPQEKTVKSRAR